MNTKRSLITTLFFFLLASSIFCQQDSVVAKKLSFTGDFRFRIEHDWDSMSSNGSKRDDRSRLRYRLRFGLKYQLDPSSSFGARLRSGNINDQQGPHVTIGGGNGEFSLVKIGFEKLYYRYEAKKWSGWIGKNDFPGQKLNELFWNDNVFPEGVSLSYKFIEGATNGINKARLHAAHFIIRSNNQTFGNDSYLQMAQLDLKGWNNRLSFFPGIYLFRNLGNLPDGQETFSMDYSIVHLGAEAALSNTLPIKLGVEFYNNLENYAQQDSIPSAFRNQKQGVVVSAKYGQLKEKGDWTLQLYYANLQKYSIVDYFAQNDWVRWDYSSVGATGSRISNFHGMEFQLGYAFDKKFNLILRAYFVEELIKTGAFLEDGNRIRLDLNIGF